MLHESVEVLPLPGDVARQTGHYPGQRTVSLPASREGEVVVRHGQEFPGVQTVVNPVLADHLVVRLLRLAAPVYRDYQVVQHSGEIRVDDVPGSLRDPVSEILTGQESVWVLNHHDLSITCVVSSSNPAMLSFLPVRKGMI